ncbi:acyltransferase [Rhodococcus sp. ARC_M12]|uniref:acyltransferase family protein n=1 Tax=Rhodococcus sp. ARC_M12 TaxID=2928854 RepID=UPI001FB3F6F0|nr:acyltransferase [Rhodococcus sp. ARC_M12]MCJ0979125.1 acyltransferase [Rhodococcus sp. ARC_M12]
MSGDRPSQNAVDESVAARPFAAPRVQMDGADLLRAIAALAVLYSHISFWVIDDLGESWWFLDASAAVLNGMLGLTLHLSLVGVGIFMLLTGLLVTRSAMRQTRRDFMVARLARLVPAFWFTLVLVLLIGAAENNGDIGIGIVDAALNFVLGGFFLTPQVLVLGVTWTLVVQAVFYLYCTAMRSVLRSAPFLVPLVGAVLCVSILLYNLTVPEGWAVPFLTRVAAILPTLFLGQIIYLAWARLVAWRWVVLAVLAQVEVVRLAIHADAFWMGYRYLWTLFVITVAVVLLARYSGSITRWPLVHWLGTRSYAIYLLHTLVLYRTYNMVQPSLGTSAAVLVFLAITAVLAEITYRWIELPAARHISATYARLRARSTA